MNIEQAWGAYNFFFIWSVWKSASHWSFSACLHHHICSGQLLKAIGMNYCFQHREISGCQETFAQIFDPAYSLACCLNCFRAYHHPDNGNQTNNEKWQDYNTIMQMQFMPSACVFIIFTGWFTAFNAFYKLAAHACDFIFGAQLAFLHTVT